MISNTPQMLSVFQLKQHRPFSLTLTLEKQDGRRVNLTGASLRMVFADVRYKGGTVRVTSNATLLSAEDGTSRFDVQGDDLGFAAGTYDMAITLTSAEGYASTVVEGQVELGYNPDPEVPADYSGVVAPLSLTATLQDSNQITVRVNHHPDSVLIDAEQNSLAYASDAAISANEAAASANAALTSAANADTSRLAAAASEASVASLVADVATIDDEVVAAQTAAAAADTSATAAAGSATAADTSEANAQAHADTALGYRDQALDYRDQALDYRDQAQDFAADAGNQADAAAQAAVALALDPIASLNARLAASRRGPVKIVTLGSSTTEGLGASRHPQRWVNQLARALQAAYPSGVESWEPSVPTLAAAAGAVPTLPGVHVINGGLSGTTSANYCDGTKQTQIDTVNPDIVIHMIGSNDHALGVTPASYATSLDSVLDTLNVSVPGVIHVICDTFSRADVETPAYQWIDYVEQMQAVADAHANAIFVGQLDEWIAAQADGYDAVDPYRLTGWRIGSGGNIHPSDSGHALLASMVARALRIPPPRPVPQPEVFDRFQRAALGNAETGQPWVQQSGTHVPSGGALTCTVAGNAVVATGFSDCEATCLLTVSGASVQGLIVKSNDSSTRIGGYYNGPSGRVEIYAGASLLGWATSGPGFGLTSGQEYAWGLSVQGDKVVLTVDGQVALEVTLAGGTVTTYQNYLQHGVRCNTADAVVKWRNFAVRRI